MKKLFITMALVLCAAAASAQVVAVAEEIVVEEQQPKRRGWAGYETNRFFDNWEITVAGGVVFWAKYALKRVSLIVLVSISHRIQLFFGNYLLLYIDSVRTSSGDIDT